MKLIAMHHEAACAGGSRPAVRVIGSARPAVRVIYGKLLPGTSVRTSTAKMHWEDARVLARRGGVAPPSNMLPLDD